MDESSRSHDVPNSSGLLLYHAQGIWSFSSPLVHPRDLQHSLVLIFMLKTHFSRQMRLTISYQQLIYMKYPHEVYTLLNCFIDTDSNLFILLSHFPTSKTLLTITKHFWDTCFSFLCAFNSSVLHCGSNNLCLFHFQFPNKTG